MLEANTTCKGPPRNKVSTHQSLTCGPISLSVLSVASTLGPLHVKATLFIGEIQL